MPPPPPNPATPARLSSLSRSSDRSTSRASSRSTSRRLRVSPSSSYCVSTSADPAPISRNGRPQPRRVHPRPCHSLRRGRQPRHSTSGCPLMLSSPRQRSRRHPNEQQRDQARQRGPREATHPRHRRARPFDPTSHHLSPQPQVRPPSRSSRVREVALHRPQRRGVRYSRNFDQDHRPTRRPQPSLRDAVASQDAHPASHRA